MGQRVQTGQLMLSVAPTNDLWITAFFKETQMRRMRVGQPATIKVDSYGLKFHGYIEGVHYHLWNKQLMPTSDA